jgi:hypothetical protein
MWFQRYLNQLICHARNPDEFEQHSKGLSTFRLYELQFCSFEYFVSLQIQVFVNMKYNKSKPRKITPSLGYQNDY